MSSLSLWSAAGVTGFVLGLGLIFSLGPQNLALIRAGMTRNHPVTVASIAYLSEIAMVAIGIGGLAALLMANPRIAFLLQLLGVGYLVLCGLRALWRPHAEQGGDLIDCVLETRHRAIATILAVTWLNPLVWLEAMFLVGVLATGYATDVQFGFAAGFLTASAIKLYGWSLLGLSLPSRLKGPVFVRYLDILSGLVFLTAASLLASQLVQ